MFREFLKRTFARLFGKKKVKKHSCQCSHGSEEEENKEEKHSCQCSRCSKDKNCKKIKVCSIVDGKVVFEPGIDLRAVDLEELGMALCFATRDSVAIVADKDGFTINGERYNY